MNFKQTLQRALLACAICVIGWQCEPALAKERIVGKVTVVDAARKKLQVDGIPYELLSNASIRQNGRFGTSKRLSDIRAGQAVRVEIENGVVRSVTLLEGDVPQ